MIEFKDIEIKYGDFTAIRDLNLTIEDGEFFTFFSPPAAEKPRPCVRWWAFWSPPAAKFW